MADDRGIISDDDSEDNEPIKPTALTENPTDKQSNRYFTQSDVDKMIARTESKVKKQFGDYDSIRAQLEELEAREKERAEAEMTEVEKANKRAEELEKELTKLKVQNVEYAKQTKRQKILSDTKYASMPRVYKDAVVSSDNEDEIIASADEILEEFKRDTGEKVRETFGIPKEPDVKKDGTLNVNPENYTAVLKAKLAERIASRLN